MKTSNKNYVFILILGDIIFFYLGLFFTLVIRYGGGFNEEVWRIHNPPFLLVHILWILIFYINGLYDLKSFTSRRAAFEKIGKSMAVAIIPAILIFYLVPSFKITPKTNLFLDIVIVSILLLAFRRAFFIYAAYSAKIKILFYGVSEETAALLNYIKNNPQIGYEISAVSYPFNEKENLELQKFCDDNNVKIYDIENDLIKIIEERGIQIIVALDAMVKEKSAAKKLYKVLPFHISVINFPSFYEIIMEKIPVSIINEYWFLENLNEPKKKATEFFKRFFDIVFVFLLGFFLLPLFVFVAIVLKMTRGEVFYSQKRIGKNGEIFNLIKFGSMVLDAEKEGVKWAYKDDPRITKFGRLLRITRVDELPQLWNVLKGEMSFIGPRPERPEFIQQLSKTIPYYEIRYLVKPGLSGWAQIKLLHGGVGEEAVQKLQYDLYYIKNRTLLFDIAIALKTLAIIVKREGV